MFKKIANSCSFWALLRKTTKVSQTCAKLFVAKLFCGQIILSPITLQPKYCVAQLLVAQLFCSHIISSPNQPKNLKLCRLHSIIFLPRRLYHHRKQRSINYDNESATSFFIFMSSWYNPSHQKVTILISTKVKWFLRLMKKVLFYSQL